MYRDQFGEFVCGALGLKGLSNLCQLIFCVYHHNIHKTHWWFDYILRVHLV